VRALHCILRSKADAKRSFNKFLIFVAFADPRRVDFSVRLEGFSCA
jgi:hypothetical protein